MNKIFFRYDVTFTSEMYRARGSENHGYEKNFSEERKRGDENNKNGMQTRARRSTKDREFRNPGRRLRPL